MKTRCIVQLRSVPAFLRENEIEERMFLTTDAVNKVLQGNMFSSLDIYWHHADIIPEKRAIKVCKILQDDFNIWAMIIKIH